MDLWVDSLKVESADFLAVHKLKVDQVRQWLSAKSTHQKMLILTGPSGAGKTATVQTLAREAGYEILEWINPIDQQHSMKNRENNDDIPDDHHRSFSSSSSGADSLIAKFEEFLNKGGKCETLSFDSVHSSTLVGVDQPPPPLSSKTSTAFSQQIMAKKPPPPPPHSSSFSSSSSGSRRFLLPPKPTVSPPPSFTTFKQSKKVATTTTTKKLILIEDHPHISNLMIRSRVQAALKNYATSPRCTYPIILIVSDILCSSDTGGGSYGIRSAWSDNHIVSLRTLVPPDLLSSTRVLVINFNPIAPTYLAKALNRIIDLNPVVARGVGKESVDAIVKASQGDIRCAINTLQFVCSNKKSSGNLVLPSSSLSSKKTAKRKKTSFTGAPMIKGLENIGCKVDNLVLFHAIGKILYNKRRPSDDDTTESTNQMQLDASRWNESYFSSYCPEPLLHTMREPLRFIPELVYESAHVGADTFNGFLFQNYPIFFQDIEELDEATEYLSIGDVLRGNWRHQSQLDPYSVSVATRGLLFSHTFPTPSVGHLRKMQKPEIWAIEKRIRERRALVESVVMLDWTKAWEADVVAVNEDVDVNRLLKQQQHHQRYRRFALSPNYPDSAVMLDLIPLLYKIARPQMPRLSPLASSIAPHQRQCLVDMNFYTPFPRGVYGGGSAATGIMRSNTMDFLGEKDLNYYEMEEQEQQQTTKKMKLDMIESFSLAEDDIEDD